jgi:hypothetical protein
MNNIIASRNNGDIVPYYGRSIIVNKYDPILTKSISTLRKLSNDCNRLSKNDRAKNKDSWKSLQQDLDYTINTFIDSNSSVSKYKLDILNEAVIPYISSMESSLSIEHFRYFHLSSLLALLSGDVSNNNNRDNQYQSHPSSTLIELESLVKDINRQSGFGLWPSRLGKYVEQAVQKQWQPIIQDNKRALSNIGGKLVCLGLVEIVGRPIIMLYPLYLVSQEVLQIVSDIQTPKEGNNKVSIKSIVNLIKAMVMLYASLQVLGVLAMYSGLGYSCLILGIVSCVISTKEDLIKIASPIISQYLKQFEALFDKLYKIETNVLSSLSNNVNVEPPPPSSSSSSSSSTNSQSLQFDTSHLSSTNSDNPLELHLNDSNNNNDNTNNNGNNNNSDNNDNNNSNVPRNESSEYIFAEAYPLEEENITNSNILRQRRKLI